MNPFEVLIENKIDDRVFEKQSECISLLMSLGEIKQTRNPKLENRRFAWEMMVSTAHPTHWIIAVNRSDDHRSPVYSIDCLARVNYTLTDVNEWADMTAEKYNISEDMQFWDRVWN